MTPWYIINRAAEGGRGSRIAFGFFNRAAEGGRGCRIAFGFFKPRSRRLGGFLLCLRFIIFFVGNYIQTSADDVIISQLQAISQLFSSYPPSGEFC